ncbi:MAG: SNF2 family N-terminal domain-containing protein [Linnemannia gamsii]|nr:MAG: SNF2 family N-terminal domain-containing protein [Linnemannia gamsii]
MLVPRDEAQDVLLLRQNAVKNEQEYQKRIKDQEQRAKIRGAANPLLGDEVLINPGHKKTERAVVIPPFLAGNLKPHQIDGLRFMWKNIVMFDGGCILAHSMGLGKTFQVVAFIYVLLTEIHSGNKDIPAKLQPGRVLLLMPPIVLQNWVDEFDKWIPPKHRNDVHVYRLGKGARELTGDDNVLSDFLLERWHKEGGVFLVGYTLFRELSTNTRNNNTRNEDTAKRFKELLLSPGPSLIFADEGHTIKNKKAKLSVAAKEIKSTARVILTGYPLQNRLEEYWCMVDFVRPKFLDNLATFRFNYIRPISDGLHIDSTEIEKKISSKKLKVLTELIKNFVMRKDQSILRASLPKKYEFVISCKLSTWQYHLYTQILPTFGGSGTGAILGNGHLLLTICNHPAAFKAATKDIHVKKTITVAKSTAAARSPLTAPSIASGTITALEESDEEPGEKEEKMVEALKYESNILLIAIVIVMDILRACRTINEKVLVFSRSIPTLDFLEYATKLAGFRSLMLDGSTPIPERQTMINNFNSDDTYDLFLISCGAGSQGVNLVSASRVIIFDVGWNPSHDEQAIARAFRYGQTRKVFVYRLQTFGTWEDKLYKTNLHKLGLSNRVVDKKTIHQAHSKTEMKSYFEPPPTPENNPRWATEENIATLFGKPDADDTVLRSVINE